jgi:hypothetical protein
MKIPFVLLTLALLLGGGVWLESQRRARAVPLSASWKEPHGVGVAHWGMSMAELRASNPAMRCERNTCTSDEWLRDDVQAETVWRFTQDKLTAVVFIFPAIQFSLVRGTFVARYGPAHQQRFPVTTGAGGFERLNETLTWEGPHVSIMLQEVDEVSARANRASATILLLTAGYARYGIPGK